MTKKQLLVTVLSVMIMTVGIAVAQNYYISDSVVNVGDQTEDIVEPSFGGSGGTFATDWYQVGNRVTWIKSGQFADGSVVLFSIPNPATGGTATSTSDTDYNDDVHMTATSTVMNVNLDITGVATSSMDILCGGAADATALPTYNMLELTLPTSTLGVVANNVTSTNGLAAIDATAINGILLTHEYNYFNCVATSTWADGANWRTDAASGGVGGLTGDANTFDGYWSVEIVKNLQ